MPNICCGSPFPLYLETETQAVKRQVLLLIKETTESNEASECFLADDCIVSEYS